MTPVARKLLLALAAATALTVAAVGCNSSTSYTQHCTPTPCGNGATLNLCTKNDSSGACSAAAYEVGSQIFVCGSCGDCTQAATQAAQACAAMPAGGGDGGVDGATDPGCSTKTACGTGGLSYEKCTTLGSDGSCSSIAYKTSDGHTFACSGCSCATAAQELSQYCADPGTGNAVTTCTSAVSCGQGLTYEQCTTTSGGVCQSSEYRVSDGQTFACAGCGNCSSASAEVTSYCGNQGGPTTSCAASVPCGSGGLTYSECTTTSAAGACESVTYELSDGGGYTCASCTDCTVAYEDVTSYCDAQTTPTTTCSTTTACGNGGATYETCTTSLGSTCQSVTYETSTGVSYQCASCSSCTTAYQEVTSYCATLNSTTVCSPACGSAATCCNCSGTPTCYTLIAGETCASFGCTN